MVFLQSQCFYKPTFTFTIITLCNNNVHDVMYILYVLTTMVANVHDVMQCCTCD